MFFATAGEKGRVKLWRSDTGTCVYEEPSGAGLVPGSAAAEYTDLSLLPGGAGLLAITADARLLFLAPGAAAEKTKGGKGAAKGAGKLAPGKGLVLSRQLVGNMDEVTDVRFVGSKSNPSHIAIATNSEAVRLFDLGGLSCVASLVGHRDTVLCLDAALAPPAPPASSSSDAAVGAAAAGAGAGVVVTLLASGAKDQEVRVWAAAAAAGAPAAASASAPDAPTDGAASSSSTYAPAAAAAAAVEVRCLGVGTGHVGAVSAVALSRRVAAGKTPFLVSAGADRLLKVWDLAGCVAAAGRLHALAGVNGSVDGGVDGSVDEAKPEALRASAAVLAHDKDVNSVAVAPNDSLVATGSQDKTAKVWRMPNLTPVATLRGHRRGVWSVEFSPVDQVWNSVGKCGNVWGVQWALPDGTDLMADLPAYLLNRPCSL